MKYIELCNLYEQLFNTSKRLEKTSIIADAFSKISDESFKIVCLFIQGRVFPMWENKKIGIAAKLVLKSISIASGVPIKNIENKWKEVGDLGLVAESLIKNKSQVTLFSEDLELETVYKNIIKLSDISGEGSMDMKVKYIAKLLSSAKPVEAKYIVRTVLEDMRVGVGDGVFRDSIVLGFFSNELNIGYSKEDNQLLISDNNREQYNAYVKIVQNAYNILNDFSKVITIVKATGIEGLKSVEISLFQPVRAMLYQKANDISDAFKRVGTPAAFEYKYDGFRMQIHISKNKIQMFTRRLEDVSKQFPDVVEIIKEYVDCDDCILDCEVVGYDPKTNQYLPFQQISQRIKRKHNIKMVADKFPVEINVFDILYANGESCLKKEFNERRGLITKIVNPVDRKIVLSRIIVTDSVDEATKFYNDALDCGEEGIMAKNLEAFYEPGSRVGFGVKVKPVMDGLDCVIVKAEWGEGKRANSLTSFTLAIADEDNNLLEIGKVSTGLKELESEGVTFAHITKLLQPLIISEEGRSVVVKPEVVIEVNFEEVQKSINYSSGFALRFPRFIRLRDSERSVDDIDRIDTVIDLFTGQRNRSS